MADFTTPDLQGANETLNKALNDATKLKDSFLANHGAEASSILSSLSALVNDLVSSFKITSAFLLTSSTIFCGTELLRIRGPKGVNIS